MADLLALTLIQPWASAIVYGHKRIENRTWAPPARLVGQEILIHAGASWDRDAAASIAQRYVRAEHEVPDWLYREGSPFKTLLGTARLVGVLRGHGGHFTGELRSLRHAQLAERSQSWFFGPVGWLLDEVRPLREPVPCKGALGLWRPSPDALAELSRHIKEVAHG